MHKQGGKAKIGRQHTGASFLVPLENGKGGGFVFGMWPRFEEFVPHILLQLGRGPGCLAGTQRRTKYLS